MVLTKAQLSALMAAIIATDGPWDPAGVFLGVAVTVVDHGVDTTLADLTMPPTSVAVRQAITTWSAEYTQIDGTHVVEAPTKHFKPSTDADATVISVWYLADAITAGNLLGYGLMPAAISLANATRQASVVARLCLDPAGRWDQTVVWNG